MGVVGEVLPKFGLTAALCRALAAGAAGAASPQSALAGRSFMAAGALTAVQVLVLATAGVIAPAVVASMAKTDRPMAAAEKPLRIAFPPRGEFRWRILPADTVCIRRLAGILTDLPTPRKQTE